MSRTTRVRIRGEPGGPRRRVATRCAEAVLEAWAKWMGLAPMTLGDGYTGRGERKERLEAYQMGDPEGKASYRVQLPGGGQHVRRRLLTRQAKEPGGALVDGVTWWKYHTTGRPYPHIGSTDFGSK
jgi:hypothetical protein